MSTFNINFILENNLVHGDVNWKRNKRPAVHFSRLQQFHMWGSCCLQSYHVCNKGNAEMRRQRFQSYYFHTESSERGKSNHHHPPPPFKLSHSAYRVCSVYTVSFPVNVWFMLGEYCALSLMHANPVTLAVGGSRCRNRGGAARGGVRPNTREVLDMLRCPPKTRQGHAHWSWKKSGLWLPAEVALTSACI